VSTPSTAEGLRRTRSTPDRGRARLDDPAARRQDSPQQTQGESETIVRRRARAKAEKLLASTTPAQSRLHALAQEIAALSLEQRAELDEMVHQLIDRAWDVSESPD